MIKAQQNKASTWHSASEIKNNALQHMQKKKEGKLKKVGDSLPFLSFKNRAINNR